MDASLGKLKAQSRLYRLFASKMYGVCLRYSRDQTEAEDNLQEGFVKIYEKIHTYRNEGSFEGWMRRIMVNVALEKYRKNNRIYLVEDVSVFDTREEKNPALSDLSTKELLKLIQQLPTRYRMVFNLYVIEGMSHSEIAKEMKISEGTSKSNLSRARSILRDKITKIYGNSANNFSA